MKTKLIPILAGLALVTAARAGTPATTQDPVQSTGLWAWFTGGSVGYLIDQEEEMYNLQVGLEYRNPADRGYHAIYLQVGFTQDGASFTNPGPWVPPPGAKLENAEIDLDVIPITLNYKYEMAFTDHLNGYLGAGVGVAIVDGSQDWSWERAVPPPNNEGGGSNDWSDARLYGEVFAGLSYEFSDSFEVFSGLRYILMDEQDRTVHVAGVSDYEEGINNEVLIELGARWRF